MFATATKSDNFDVDDILLSAEFETDKGGHKNFVFRCVDAIYPTCTNKKLSINDGEGMCV